MVSWLLLRGRCRSCKTRISARYPAVEALTAALFVAAAWRLGARAELADYCIFFAVLVVLSGIDLDHQLIPSRIIYPASVTSLAALAIASGVDGQWRRFGDGVLGGVIGFVVLFAVHMVAPRGMGFGDVRLAGYIGLNVAWLGLAHVAVALFAGFLFGAVVGVALIGAGAATRRSRIPFGPFLAAGAVTAVLWGTPIVHWWLGPR